MFKLTLTVLLFPVCVFVTDLEMDILLSFHFFFVYFDSFRYDATNPNLNVGAFFFFFFAQM